MKTNFLKKHLSFVLCMVLIVAMALSASGCNGNTDKEAGSASTIEKEAPSESTAEKETSSESAAEKEPDAQTDGQVVGEGDTQFDFSVVDQDGSETHFEIHTDKETVGEALAELGVIEGEDSEYGLFVKTVNGVTVDFEKDGKYWAFYINGEYAESGVDTVAVTEGDSYSFKAE